MGHDDRREIYERLEALERLVRSRSEEQGSWDEPRRGGRDRRDHERDHHHRDRDRHDHRGRHEHHDRHDRRDHHDRGDRDCHHRHHGRDDHGHERGGGDFEEKRIIDTIVQLVGERLERFIQDQQARTKGRDDDGRERRVIDHVVRQVGEHVREVVQRVVASELDRRVGPPRDERPRESRPRDESGPE